MQGGFFRRRSQPEDPWLSNTLLASAWQTAALLLDGDSQSVPALLLQAINRAATFHQKLVYYQLASRRHRNKLVFDKVELFQYFLYESAHSFEVEQERECLAGRRMLSERALIARYIKHLLLAATKNRSFSVAVGLCRLLYSYKQSQLNRIYEAVTQYGGPSKSDDQYRECKLRLMESLIGRFEGFLTVCEGAKQEKSFQGYEDQSRVANYVNQCLVLFTPWTSSCSLPGHLSGFLPDIPPLSFVGPNADDEHPIEWARIHTLIHPTCFSRLTEALKCSPPEERLSMPQISTNGRWRNDPTDPTPTLLPTNEDLRNLTRTVEEQRYRRQRSRPRELAILVDGTVRGRIDVAKVGSVTFDLSQNDDLIQIFSKEQPDDVLLSTISLRLIEIWGVRQPWKSSLALESGQRIRMRLYESTTRLGSENRGNQPIRGEHAKEERLPIGADLGHDGMCSVCVGTDVVLRQPLLSPKHGLAHNMGLDDHVGGISLKIAYDETRPIRRCLLLLSRCGHSLSGWREYISNGRRLPTGAKGERTALQWFSTPPPTPLIPYAIAIAFVAILCALGLSVVRRGHSSQHAAAALIDSLEQRAEVLQEENATLRQQVQSTAALAEKAQESSITKERTLGKELLELQRENRELRASLSKSKTSERVGTLIQDTSKLVSVSGCWLARSKEPGRARRSLPLSLSGDGKGVANAEGVYIPKDTALNVELLSEIDTRTNEKGDVFKCQILDGDYEGGQVLGKVKSINAARGRNPAKIDLVFERILFPGQSDWRPFDAAVEHVYGTENIANWGEADEEGQVWGISVKPDWKKILSFSGVGAAVGGAAGGLKGAAVGAADGFIAGATITTIIARTTNMQFKSGTRFRVRAAAIP